jgi:hypothetical protein
MTDDLINRIGREHVRGRRLMVGTANLDAQRMVIWNMGAFDGPAASSRAPQTELSTICAVSPLDADAYCSLGTFKRRHVMRTATIGLTLAILMTGCASNNGYDRPSSQWRNYDYNRPDPSYGGYDAGRYYREDSRARERRLSRRDRVYRGQDGRYYCRRSDGTTGLVIGAVVGGVLGNQIAPGESEVLGTILGAAAGALVGRAIDRGEARCR